MTAADDDYASLGEAPDSRPCVALNVSLRMAIVEAQIALQRELRQGGAGCGAVSSVPAAHVDALSELGIPSGAHNGGHGPATTDQRLVLLRSELAALRARIEPPPEDMPTQHSASGLPTLVTALPEQHLAALLGLSADEIELAWLAVAWAVQPALFDEVTLDAPRGGVSTALFVRLRRFATTVEERGFVLALRTSKLFTHGLLQCVGDDNGMHTEWRAAPALVAFVTGALVHDARFSIVGFDRVVMGDAQQPIVNGLRSCRTMPGVLLQLHGPAHSGRAFACAWANIFPLWRADLQGATDAAAVRALLQDFRAHITLMDVSAVLLENVETLWQRNDAAALAAVAEFVDAHPFAVFATVTQRGSVPTQQPGICADWPVPDAGARAMLWDELALRLPLPPLDPDMRDRLAQRFAVRTGAIWRALQLAARREAEWHSERIDEAVLVAALQSATEAQASELEAFCTRVETRQTWDDLVLPEAAREQALLLLARCRATTRVRDEWGYGAKLAPANGTMVLLSGAPSVGKTLSAGVISRVLGRTLFAVDLSRVVSKWIGETEANLRKVFAAAEAEGCALLFDEADSLFGQRAAVRTASDRYANMEVNYLLNRIERFNGLVFLTTNQPEAIDPAMHRRLAMHIVLPLPNEAERAELWHRMLHAGSAPLAADIDVADLARRFPDMSGANIRNAVLNALYLAASEGGDMQHAHLVRGGKAEYRAMGKVETSLRLLLEN
jgi:AAA+ superfamily predicted ATPase